MCGLSSHLLGVLKIFKPLALRLQQTILLNVPCDSVAPSETIVLLSHPLILSLWEVNKQSFYGTNLNTDAFGVILI